MSKPLALSLLLAGLAVPVLAQSPAGPLPPSPLPVREQVRLRILDVCVTSRSAKVGQDADVVTPCQCYAKDLLPFLSEGDVAAVLETGRLPPILRDRATEVFSACTAPKPGR